MSSHATLPSDMMRWDGMGLRVACGCGTNLECGNNHTAIQGLRCEAGMGMGRRRAAFARSAGYARAATRGHNRLATALFSVLQDEFTRVSHRYKQGISRAFREYQADISRKVHVVDSCMGFVQTSELLCKITTEGHSQRDVVICIFAH